MAALHAYGITNLLVKVEGEVPILDGSAVEFMATCRVDTPVEVEYLRNGGILHMVVRRMAAS